MKSSLHWSPLGFRPHHGICLPLFSLHTKHSFGVGEYLDLLPLIDWCKSIHLDCIQLLPLNDTGNETSPYYPLSSCALDPIYISLKPLGIIETFPSTPRYHRQEVLSQKIALLKNYFLHAFSTIEKTPSYQAFLREHHWLEEYAHFKGDSDFYSFLQYICFSQMQTVRAHATQQGVFLKGDIPILLNPASPDVQNHSHLFHFDLDAGAPPDTYNPLGQNWGSPLFNWEAMRAENYQWWKRRLKVLEKLYHIYRIDHVVGFFRIWGIQKGKKPHDGSFYPSDESQWADHGRELLEMMLAASPLLPIAEDLGTVPQLVYPILKELGICGTKVMRWQRNWDTDRSYIPINTYDSLSMTTVSTADLPPLALWWKDYPNEAVSYAAFKHWSYHPILSQKQRLEILHDAHHTASLFHINPLEEYLALFPELVSANPEEARINHPGTLLPTNWTYRFRPSLEEIVQHEGLHRAFAQILRGCFK